MLKITKKKLKKRIISIIKITKLKNIVKKYDRA